MYIKYPASSEKTVLQKLFLDKKKSEGKQVASTHNEENK